MVEPPSNEVRIVLIGKTGNGKSKTGNTILGEKVFDCGASATSITTTCQLRDATRFQKKISLVDTPGAFDNRTNNEEIQNEIKRCIWLTSPGPHAIILCVQTNRFTKEDVETVEHFCSYFGENLAKYVIVLFTRFDDWKRDSGNSNIQGFIDTLPCSLTDFLQKCKNRYIAFDNTLTGDEANAQVEGLLSMIENMVRENGGSHYTSEDYQRAEIALRKQIMEDKAKKEREILEMQQRIRKEADEELRKMYEERERKLKADLEKIRNETKSSNNWLDCVIEAGVNLVRTIFRF